MLKKIVGKRPSIAAPRSMRPRFALFFCLYAVTLMLTSLGPVFAQQENEYLLGHEDVISVTVLRHPEFSGEFLIPNDGNVDIPRVGKLHVAGKTLAEVAYLLTVGLRSTLVNPEVSVSLRVQRPQTVYVLGSVRSPGPQPFKPGWRITEAVSAAGGLVQGIEPADCIVHILRGSTGAKESVPYRQAVSGDESYNKALQAGDVVTVEAPENISFYVTGKVYRPGAYTLRKDNAGLLQAITLAGGTMESAALSKVTVTHLNGESETVDMVRVTIDGKQSQSLMLQSGDLVVVPDYAAKFAIIGWVNSPGVFDLKENQKMTLSDALAMARGIDNRRSGLSQVAILRLEDGKQTRMLFDYTKFARKGDVTQNPEIKPGDVILVPETNKPDWDRIVARISSGISMLWTLDRFQIW